MSRLLQRLLRLPFIIVTTGIAQQAARARRSDLTDAYSARSNGAHPDDRRLLIQR